MPRLAAVGPVIQTPGKEREWATGADPLKHFASPGVGGTGISLCSSNKIPGWQMGIGSRVSQKKPQWYQVSWDQTWLHLRLNLGA